MVIQLTQGVNKQHEITNPGPLLRDGILREPGWARKPLLEYNRDQIQSGWWRIKEWDYYAVLTEKYGVTFTFTDLGILGLINITWLDFTNQTFIVSEDFKLLTRGNLDLPSSSLDGDLVYEGKHLKLSILNDQGNRKIIFKDLKFDGDTKISGELIIKKPKNQESMVIATPWKDVHGKFYYNRKLNCLPTQGEVTLGNEIYEFNPSTAYTVLDWGRGVWPYNNTWYWGSASGTVDGVPVGFNIGYGFGDLSKATENIIFYDGIGHKLDQVTFEFDEGDYLKIWKFTSTDGRFEMTMEPILDRNATVNLLIFKSIQHQVFGKFSGTLILDDGTKVEITNMIGFAEKVVNRW